MHSAGLQSKGGSTDAPEHGGTYYDRQEVRDPREREQALFHALPGLIRHALDNTSFFAQHLEGIDPDTISDRAALASLPVLRRDKIAQSRRAALPFGGMVATSQPRLAKLFVSADATYEPEGSRADYWRLARAMFAAGFKPGELVLNSFSYHLTPAGSMAEAGARALGCPVLPGGNERPELQARAVADLAPRAYVGGTSFLLSLLDTGERLKLDLRSLDRALVAGPPLSDHDRQFLRERHGIIAYQCYATSDLGLIAYETHAFDGLMIDESIILEIVRPGTGEPVAEGETGEVVVTAFNPDYPLIRFATGDLTAVIAGESACGRTNTRIRADLGRLDPTAPDGRLDLD